MARERQAHPTRRHLRTRAELALSSRLLPGVDRLFNGFDYRARDPLYETLIEHPGDAAARRRQVIFPFITNDLLRHAPSVPLEERAISPHLPLLVPEVVAMFEWAHMLHRQLYDLFADGTLSDSGRDAAVRRLVHYYQSRPDLAFGNAAPKDMAPVEGQPYSLVFQQQDPKFNGLLWSYHWLQMALYDAQLASRDPSQQRANIEATVRHFWAMLDDAPRQVPELMPVSAGDRAAAFPSDIPRQQSFSITCIHCTMWFRTFSHRPPCRCPNGEPSSCARRRPIGTPRPRSPRVTIGARWRR